MRPSDTGMRPSDTGMRPSDTGMRPSDTGMRLSDTGMRPSDTGMRPSDTVDMSTLMRKQHGQRAMDLSVDGKIVFKLYSVVWKLKVTVDELIMARCP
ncbi:unnamed protein product [Toxocara canis]|uniref:Pentapeptide repeat-containing protein n=1 Tax=Toxocara canis TaxID=6265 RepID=A0A183UXY0_TOXCA|nr:unnamed protein product [Toxocara canis]